MAMKPAEVNQARIAIAMLKQALIELAEIKEILMCTPIVADLIVQAAAHIGREVGLRQPPLTGREGVTIVRPKRKK